MKEQEILSQLNFDEFRNKINESRKGINIIELVDDDIPIFENPNRVTNYIVCEDGYNIASVSKSSRLFCPLFEIMSNDLKISDFDTISDLLNVGITKVIEREQLTIDTLKEYIKEDYEIFLVKRTDICFVPFNSQDNDDKDNYDSIAIFECIGLVASPKGSLQFVGKINNKGAENE